LQEIDSLAGRHRRFVLDRLIVVQLRVELAAENDMAGNRPPHEADEEPTVRCRTGDSRGSKFSGERLEFVKMTDETDFSHSR
jgi:hypothetical protein